MKLPIIQFSHITSLPIVAALLLNPNIKHHDTRSWPRQKIFCHFHGQYHALSTHRLTEKY